MELSAGIESMLWAALIGAVSLLLGFGGAAALTAPRALLRRSAWALAIACFFSPPLLIGYAYANFTPLVHGSEGVRTACYALLMALRLMPVAAVIRLMSPGRVSPEAQYCLRLLQPRLGFRARFRQAIGVGCRGVGRAGVAGFGVTFVLAFTEFELASFLGVDQWTVALFDAQAGGMALGASLRLIAWPALLGLTVAALSAGMVAPALSATGSAPPAALSRVRWGLASLALGAVCVLLLPGAIVLRGGVAGIAQRGLQLALYHELAASLLVAGGAAAAACGVAWAVCAPGRTTRRMTRRRALMVALMIPGLCGGLILGLCLLALLQAPLLWRLRDTPLPLMVASALLALPAAMLMVALLRGRRTTTDVHAARLLRTSAERAVRRRGVAIDWRRRTRCLYWAAALLVCHLFYDVTLASLLAPVQMPLVTPRLYNFMHYGRSHLLTASLLLCVVVPPVVLALIASGFRLGRSLYAAPVEL